MTPSVSRRALLGGTAAATFGAFGIREAAADTRAPRGEASATSQDSFTYEITRPDAEWRARLSEEEYHILREGGTELPETSDLWDVFDDGTYSCRGCDLLLFASEWKRDVNLGWNFFRHSEPNAILTGIDGAVAAYGQAMGGGETLIEVHCRRCGSHLGHLLRVRRDTLHCINGKALTFRPQSA